MPFFLPELLCRLHQIYLQNSSEELKKKAHIQSTNHFENGTILKKITIN